MDATTRNDWSKHGAELHEAKRLVYFFPPSGFGLPPGVELRGVAGPYQAPFFQRAVRVQRGGGRHRVPRLWPGPSSRGRHHGKCCPGDLAKKVSYESNTFSPHKLCFVGGTVSSVFSSESKGGHKKRKKPPRRGVSCFFHLLRKITHRVSRPMYMPIPERTSARRLLCAIWLCLCGGSSRPTDRRPRVSTSTTRRQGNSARCIARPWARPPTRSAWSPRGWEDQRAQTRNDICGPWNGSARAFSSNAARLLL